MGYKRGESGINLNVVCDECGDSMLLEEDILIRIGWELIDAGKHKYCYCPECSEELSMYQKMNGGSDTSHYHTFTAVEGSR